MSERWEREQKTSEKIEVESGTSEPVNADASDVSKVLRFHEFSWSGVERKRYKDEPESWRGVARHLLVGEEKGETPFDVRYFEVEPGGYTSFERHQHRHAVIVIRGGGSVRLGDRVETIEFGDVVYVAPDEPHQFRAADEEKLGFLCIVAAERDKPELVTPDKDKDEERRVPER